MYTQQCASEPIISQATKYFKDFLCDGISTVKSFYLY